jgi:chemotaxis protein histidine kinase CheA
LHCAFGKRASPSLKADDVATFLRTRRTAADIREGIRVHVNTPELSVAIVAAGDRKYGLVVDRFLVQVEVLVKPLAGGLEGCKEFQGAAIMGDGRVVLALNALECHNFESRRDC